MESENLNLMKNLYFKQEIILILNINKYQIMENIILVKNKNQIYIIIMIKLNIMIDHITKINH